eukprot:3645078-Rhodomonas_salina.1
MLLRVSSSVCTARGIPFLSSRCCYAMLCTGLWYAAMLSATRTFVLSARIGLPGSYPALAITSSLSPTGYSPRPYTLDPRPWTLDPRLQTLDPRPWTLDPRP